MIVTDIISIIILLSLSYFTFFHLVLWYESRNTPNPRNLKNKELSSVSILVPVYNEEDVIQKSLRKLLSINYPKQKLEIIVIDDGSTDKTYELAKKFKSKNVKIFTKPNTGKASSLNFGIKHAKYSFVAVIDGDSFLDSNALRNCMKYFDEDVVSAVTSHILVKKQETIWEKMQQTENMIISVMRKAQEKLNFIGVTPGPFSVYRKKDLVKVGGFDEKNLVEDVEIAWKLLKHGYKIRMAFDALAYSIYPENFIRWWKQRVRWTIGGAQTFFKYFSTMFDKTSHGVGTFWVPVTLLTYLLSFIGVGAFLYLVGIRIFNYLLFIVTALSANVNPLINFDFSYNVNLLVIYGVIVFFLSLFVLRLAIKTHHERIGIKTLVLFNTIYPILLTAILLYSTYKFIRMERSWMTK